jgi:BMFP domain-containing protein YqiC
MTSHRPKQSQSEQDRFESILAKFKRDNAALRQRVAELERRASRSGFR